MDQKRTWIYCRIAHSGPDSVDVLAGQRLQLETYAKKHGLEIVGSSSDIGSGLTLDRPGLLDFLDAVEDESVDVLLLLNLARLGRNINTVVQYWNLLRGLGVHVYTVMNGEFDLSIKMTLQEITRK